MTETKDLLLDGIPPLQAPPDRLAAIHGRATARRRTYRTGAALAALASVVALGTTMAVLTPAAPADHVGGPADSSPPIHSASGIPTSPVPSYSMPPKDFPMPGPGVCPPSVDFVRMPLVDAWPGGMLPQISGVTLCRYTQSDFDLGKGENSLTSGPKAGDVHTFRNALVIVATPIASSSGGSTGEVSSSASTGTTNSSCRPASAPFTVDVIFVHSPDGTTKAEIQHRYECGPVPAVNPWAALRTAVDAELGSP